MSAAATAAGYLYASGRLRGRAGREQEEQQQQQQQQAPQHQQPGPAPRERDRIRVAVLSEPKVAEKPRRTPKIEYRVRRRWSAG